jgi:hypothetical protein
MTSATPTTIADGSWQRLWFSTLRKPWDSLAIVPCESGIDAHKVAEVLVNISRDHGAKPVRLLNGVGLQPSSVETVMTSIKGAAEKGEGLIVPVDPLHQNPSAMPIARGTTSVLFVLRMGQSRLNVARTTIEIVGSNRVIGSVVVG